MFENQFIISDLNVKLFFSPKSFFRHYQEIFLMRYGQEIRGELIEIGCEKQYNHQRFFPYLDSFRCTNIARNYDEFLDVQCMDLDDNSVDAFLCVSVLEHIYDVPQAFRELERVLKPQGQLLLTVPFAYPYHDVEDYWRLSVTAYQKLLNNFEVRAFVHLGGVFSTIIDNLRRPTRAFGARHLVYKGLGFFILMFFRWLEQPDWLPLGYGIYAVKK